MTWQFILIGILVAASAPAIAEPKPAIDPEFATMRAYVVEGLPVVERFEEALVNTDRGRVADATTADFHVVDRSDYDTKLGLDALLRYIEGCPSANRMSANVASIAITHVCKGYEYRDVLYNVRDGRVSRVVIGEIPSLTIKRAD